MKKLLSFFLVVVMLLFFSACGMKDEIVVPEEEMIESEFDIKTETEPEQQESPEEIPESYIKIENGKLSGKIYPMIDTEKDAKICKDELVYVSMSVPEGWEQGTLEEEGEICGITFKLPGDNYHYASLFICKDTGKTYDEFLANHSLWVGINEHTYHEVEGNFLKGSYIHFNYPAFDKYDHEEDAVPVYGRFYQLKFDGYVADVSVYIRIDSEENTLLDEKICDEFISSIKIG